MSSGERLPKGSQISDGLKMKRSEGESTVTSTSPWSSCFIASAAVRPPKLLPSTSTFLRISPRLSLHLYHRGYGIVRRMCRQVTCRKCQRPTWKGCGAHIEQVLGHVPPSERCQCQAQAAPREKKRLFGSRRS